MKINKSFLTNAIALLLVGTAFLMPQTLYTYFLSVGLFALSGSLTNTIAIHMLFEKVPFLYGSGVITLKFDTIKASIATMIMQEFLTLEHIEKFTQTQSTQGVDLEPVLAKVDLSPAFEGVVEMIMESSLGGMLGMFGGEKMIRQFEAPFETKMREKLIAMSKEDAFQELISQELLSSHTAHDWFLKIEVMVLARVNELTPLTVKSMVKKMIAEHLGWLVVWGGVFGGLIGLVSAMLLA